MTDPKSTRLSPEILSEIFQYLNDDSHSLSVCVRVSKKWAEQAVPVLWNNPFQYLSEENMKSRIKTGSQILETYLLLLDEDSYATILESGILLPSGEHPYFEYATFFKHYNFHVLSEVTHSWLLNSETPLPDEDEDDDDDISQLGEQNLLNLLIIELSKLFMMSSLGFQSLNLFKEEETQGNIPALARFPGALDTLAPTKEFTVLRSSELFDSVEWDNVLDLLDLMTNTCIEIQVLKIYFEYEVDYNSEDDESDDDDDSKKGDENEDNFEDSRDIGVKAIQLIDSQTNLETLEVHNLKKKYRKLIEAAVARQGENLRFIIS
ncbi:hypothetical protein G9A89_004407 [Geosiphon pyriformis]|nr:hypothetical protein G9A89_004407 [Geosiphon pyriformis]